MNSLPLMLLLTRNLKAYSQSHLRWLHFFPFFAIVTNSMAVELHKYYFRYIVRLFG